MQTLFGNFSVKVRKQDVLVSWHKLLADILAKSYCTWKSF